MTITLAYPALRDYHKPMDAMQRTPRLRIWGLEIEMENYADLSGFDDWDWGDEGRMDFNGFRAFVAAHRNANPYASIPDQGEQMAALMAGYCIQQGGRLSDWAIRHNGDVEHAAEKYGLKRAGESVS